MMSKLIPKFLLFIIIIFTCSISSSQKPLLEPLEGQFTKSFGLTIGKCKISSMSVKYSLSTIVGEPTIYTNLKWVSTNSNYINCLADEKFEIFIQVYVSDGTYYIPAQGSFGLVPKGDASWGNNPLSGSPDWDELFLTDLSSVRAFDEKNRNYLSAENAKYYWKSGKFRVAGIVLLEENGDKTTFN